MQRQWTRGVRTWDQIKAELEKRHGIRISNCRVQQIARRAEQKIAAEIEKLFPGYQLCDDDPRQSRRIEESN
jgi:hypothetical protein